MEQSSELLADGRARRHRTETPIRKGMGLLVPADPR